MKYRLYAPGPTPVPEEVLTEMAKPILHHRTPAAEKIVEEVREGLKWLFQTKEEVLIFASSGSGAMEASIVNLLGKKDKALFINGGKFGERWGKICKAYGIEAEGIDVEWGHAVDVNIIKEKLASDDYRAVFVQASETSTGVEHPVKEIAEVVKQYDNTALVVDGITGVGVFPLPMDEWGIDILICGSQKALMLPPGLAVAGVSQKAYKIMENSDSPKFYFNMPNELKNIKKNTTAWTPAISLIAGLKVVLKMMKEEGLEAMFERHAKMAKAIQEAAKSIGLKLFAPESPSRSVSAIYGPEGMDAQKIVAYLRDELNMTIAGGQDDAKGKIFRIGHLGYYDAMDMITVWAGVEMALAKLGYEFEQGKGVATAMKILSE